jgi:hypothetical protein
LTEALPFVNNPPIEVNSSTPISPHNAALYEAGKTLLVQSVEVGREFCKFMIGICTGAIPIHLSLVGLIADDAYKPSARAGALLLCPAFVFLLAAVAFAVGYFPVRSKFSLDLPKEIENARTATMNRRYKFSRLGFIGFCFGVVVSIAAICTLLIRTR